MKTSRCVSIQIFPFQLLLFWWAYCSLFPRHPAAILQLLIFTSMEEGKKKKAALSSGFFSVFCFFLPRKFGGKPKYWGRETPDMYRSISDQKSPSPLLMSSSKIIVWYSKTRTWKYSVSCVVPSTSLELKMKALATAQWCLTDGYEFPNIIRKELALVVHTWCWITR